MTSSVEDNVLDIISKYAEISRDQLTLDVKLEDTGLDSMGVVETLFDLEELYAVDIPDSDAIQDRFNLGTIRDIIRELEKLIAAKESAT